MNLAYVDSGVWIALLEGQSAYQKLLHNELAILEAKQWDFCISDAVLLEVLIKPHQLGRYDLIRGYRELFKDTFTIPNFQNALVNCLPIAQQDQLKPLDTLHVSFALAQNCGLFVTTDPHFKNLKSLPVHGIDLRSSVQP